VRVSQAAIDEDTFRGEPANAPAASKHIPVEFGADIARRTLALYREGQTPGDPVGLAALGELYTVKPGQWTLVSGMPGSGKSEFVDQITFHLAQRFGWQWSVYSPENHPTEQHVAKLAEKMVGLPFGKRYRDRMAESDLLDAIEYITARYTFLKPKEATVWQLLHDAEIWRDHSKKFGIVIDPFSRLNHMDRGSREDQYVASITEMVTDFVRGMDAHVFLIVHPKTIDRMKDGKRPVPTPSDISGGAQWFNGADNILVVDRPTKADNGPEVEIHIQKVRFKHCGRLGVAHIHYDAKTGRYHDPGRDADRDLVDGFQMRQGPF
jgi:twinkle protein